MKNLLKVCTLIVLGTSFVRSLSERVYQYPTVGASIIVRNKAHTLPYFFSCFNNLDYPKDRMYVWIYTDYNEDNTTQVIEKWEKEYGSEYNNVFITSNKTSGPLHIDEERATHWSPAHFKHVIKLREKALNFGRKMWADYFFMIDADVFLTNPDTLKVLVKKELTIAAPMLASDGMYSNFWCGMRDYYYERTEDYEPILKREKTGCFEVPMVHTAVLVMLKDTISNKLTYDPVKIVNYHGPEDDIISFAVSAAKNGVKLHICNDIPYGFLPVPLEDTAELKDDLEQLRNVKLEALSRGTPLPLLNEFKEFVSYPNPWKFGLDEIFMINLECREKRRNQMQQSFKELGMDVTVIKAVDGKTIDLDNLKKYSVTLMPKYEDPFHNRPMKAGEIGCFLSHYNIWKEIARKNIQVSLILEDDVHFVPYFRQRLYRLSQELKQFDWDLVYIGRKIFSSADEKFVSENLVIPQYSYWTLGYMITEQGARKLIRAEPLSKLLPVDEFLPIMFDQHPNTTWKSFFPRRDLKALSASPLLANPTHYTGDDGYISDTEDSHIIDPTYYTSHDQLVEIDEIELASDTSWQVDDLTISGVRTDL